MSGRLAEVGRTVSARHTRTVSQWTRRHRLVALGAGVATALLIGLPTDVVPNPVFGRSIGVTWWSYPALIVTSVLSGLLAATYVRDPRLAAADGDTAAGRVAGGAAGADDDGAIDRPTRTAGIGGLFAFFAVGCPVCNKLVLLALGTTGAVRWFEPVQPFLAVVSVALLVWALRARLRSAVECRL